LLAFRWPGQIRRVQLGRIVTDYRTTSRLGRVFAIFVECGGRQSTIVGFRRGHYTSCRRIEYDKSLQGEFPASPVEPLA
jgi:hypothetical protein